MTAGDEHDAPVTDDDPKVEQSDNPEEIRAQIEETRQELGETVEALAAKVDVKAQVKDKVKATKETVKDKADVAKTKASELASTTAGAVPEPARQAIDKAQQRARRRPAPFIGAAVAMLAALIARRRFKRRRAKH
ncbi:MAG: DUF3618 domain-containing protein [Actinomycetota bacterium]|jgi:dsDNA-specific endonuclease/ATPase MutS2